MPDSLEPGAVRPLLRGRFGRDYRYAEQTPSTQRLHEDAREGAVAVASDRLPELTLVAGEACAEAIAAVTGLAPAIKHPNDVLVDGRKVAGILAEARDGRVVLGIGINVNAGPDELPTETETPAGSLSLVSGQEVSRAELLAELLLRLEQRYDHWIAGG